MKLTNESAWNAQVGLLKKALSVIGPKRRDYSGVNEPLSNFYKSTFFGVEPWRGALIRLSDKLSRIQQLAEKAGRGEVRDESLIDTAADAVNYVFLVLGLILEAAPEETTHSLLDELLRWSEADWPRLAEPPRLPSMEEIA